MTRIPGFIFIFLLAANVFGQDFYNINTINTIELTFTESNWDYLLDNLVSEGQENRLLGSAVVNGISYDSVGVRYKGNSSYSANRVKNPLNIKLDYVINDQEHEGYGTLKLANVYKDPSFIREVLSYEIARNYMPSSLANFTKVYINGTYLGLYTSVQDVDKYFLRSNYYSSGNPFFKGELASGARPTSVKIWGYFGADSASYTNYYEIESDEGWANLIYFLNTLNNNASEVAEVLNVDRHLWMLAFDMLMVNLDAPVNFAHNYYLYQDDTGRFNPIIWDLNENFGVFSMLLDGGSLGTSGMQRLDPFLKASDSNYPIISQILSDPTYKKIYVAHMKTIMDEYFSNGLYRSRALEIQNIIDAEVQNDPNKFYTYTQFKDNIDSGVGGGGRPGPDSQSIVGITELMNTRISYLNSLSEFQATEPAISNLENTPTNPQANTEVWITAEVMNAEAVQLAHRSRITDVFEMSEMQDDGNHNDGAAGDGVYGVSIPTGATGFQYYIYAENENAAAFSPRRAAYEFYMLTVSADLVINEFLASNESANKDSQDEYDDWIELYNNTDADIMLKGYFLSDDGDDLTQWAFPDTFIAANSFLIIWADKDEEQGRLHTNFKLSASGEVIYLVNSEATIIDEVVFGEQTTDISTGRYPNGTGVFVQMDPTFSTENIDTITTIINKSELPLQFNLAQNYPNPFNPITTISFDVPYTNRVSLKIYNAKGQLITKLVDQQLTQGNHEFQWQANNIASGIYYYKLTSGSFSETKRMILLK